MTPADRHDKHDDVDAPRDPTLLDKVLVAIAAICFAGLVASAAVGYDAPNLAPRAYHRAMSLIGLGPTKPLPLVAGPETDRIYSSVGAAFATVLRQSRDPLWPDAAYNFSVDPTPRRCVDSGTGRWCSRARAVMQDGQGWDAMWIKGHFTLSGESGSIMIMALPGSHARVNATGGVASGRHFGPTRTWGNHDGEYLFATRFRAEGHCPRLCLFVIDARRWSSFLTGSGWGGGDSIHNDGLAWDTFVGNGTVKSVEAPNDTQRKLQQIRFGIKADTSGRAMDALWTAQERVHAGETAGAVDVQFQHGITRNQLMPLVLQLGRDGSYDFVSSKTSSWNFIH